MFVHGAKIQNNVGIGSMNFPVEFCGVNLDTDFTTVVNTRWWCMLSLVRMLITELKLLNFDSIFQKVQASFSLSGSWT